MKFCDNDHELVRIGGRSNSAALQKYNLSTIKSASISKKKSKFNHRGDKRQTLQQRLITLENQIHHLEIKIKRISDSIVGEELVSKIGIVNTKHCTQLNKLANESELTLNEAILKWLSALEPEQFTDGVSLDERDVPTDAEIQENLKEQISGKIKESQTMSTEQAAKVADIIGLSLDDRWNLYRLWVKLYTQDCESEIEGKRKEYQTECLSFNEQEKLLEIEIVKKAKIIGMTTTGAAKYRYIIDGIKPQITSMKLFFVKVQTILIKLLLFLLFALSLFVVVEEAAEALEAHVVTALSEQTNHLILMGDHLQLRPNPSVYELAKKYSLEVSLFERFIKNQMEYYQLKQQHRMRPCISSLLVPNIYKQLLNHPCVMGYENVKGELPAN